jgi:hypothetical protein
MVFAQNSNDIGYQQLAGKYGSTDGICLFEDGKFLLYGYATAVFGSYKFEQDHLFFYPEKPPLFEVYATHNKSIGDSTKINFVGFERGARTYIRMGKGRPMPVFNEDANCFNSPYVYQQAQKTQEFTLYAQQTEETGLSSVNGNNAYTYQNQLLYNDFMIVHNAAKREYENFSATVIKSDKGQTLRLSNFGGEQGYVRHTVAEQDEQWKEILDMKNNYYESKLRIADGALANKHYNNFFRVLKEYDFDASLNQYVSKSATENEGYFRDNPYNDDRFLRKFIKQQPVKMTKANLSVKEISSKSIFFSVCGEGAEKSYRYKGLNNQNSNGDENPRTIITPVPPPQKQ